MTGPPDDGTNPPEESLTDWLSAEHVVVPDDISSLEQDIALYRRERTQARRQAIGARLLPRRWRRYGVTAPMLIVSLLLMGSFGGMLILFGPRGHGRPALSALPLARTTVPAGRVGGLLPALELTALDGATVNTRALDRPAVLTLVPPGCACAAAVRAATDTAEPFAFSQYVVTESAAAARPYLVGNTPPDQPLIDGERALLAAYGGSGSTPTLVVLARDGAVQAIIPAAGDDAALTAALQKALGPSLSAPAGS